MQATITIRGGLRNGVRTGVVAALIAGLVAFAPGKAEARPSSAERQMVALINKARAEAGRAPLKMSGVLSRKARRHSKHMMRRNTIFHNPKLAYWMRGLNWRMLGENVGMGGSIGVLHKAFMASPSHRANNLDRRFRKIGVGVRTRNGRIFVTVIFYR